MTASPGRPSTATRFATLLADLTDCTSELDRYCEAGQLLLDGEGAAITTSYDRPTRHTVSSTSPLSLLIEDAQDVAGEGPGVDASRTGQVVTGSFGPRRSSPWPVLEGSVAGLGFVGSVLALPITVPAGRLGVLVVHRFRTSLTFDLEAAAFLRRTLGTALQHGTPPGALELLDGGLPDCDSDGDR